MSSTTKTLESFFGTTDFLIPLVLGDLTDEQARTRTRDGEGPSVAWLVGHMLEYRYRIMNMLGAGLESPYARFGETGATDGSDYPTLAELREAWTSVAEQLYGVLDGATEETFERPVEGGPHAEQSFRDAISFYTWHEAYHIGALGAVRKALGQPGPAERVMAMREQQAAQAGA